MTDTYIITWEVSSTGTFEVKTLIEYVMQTFF